MGNRMEIFTGINGKIKYCQGDCNEALKKMPAKSVDLAIVDPLYFNGPNKLGYYGARVSKTSVYRKEYKKIGSWDIPDQKYFDQLCRVSKNQIIWGINYYDIKNLGAGRIIWDKVNGTSSFSDCEIAYCSMNERVDLFRFMWNGMMQGADINNGDIQQGNKKLNEKRIHPTQKPVALYKWILSKYAQPGWKILDTHLGSGSIGEACHDDGFELEAYETDQDYFKGACERLRKHQRQQTFNF